MVAAGKTVTRIHGEPQRVNIRIVCIGNEILSGETLNTNLAFSGEKLAEIGCRVCREVCVPDESSAIRQAVREALEPPACVITIGGLGPTGDDITRQTVAALLEKPLLPDPRVAAGIRRFLQARGRTIPESAISAQAMVPQDAEVLPNENGTAPGLCFHLERSVLFMLPGPPREYRPLFCKQVLPEVRRLAGSRKQTAVIRICGVPESRVEEKVRAILEDWQTEDIAFCARPEAVAVILSASSDRRERLASAVRELRRAFGADALPEACGGLPEYVGRMLEHRHWKLATAESCTGGAIAAAVTGVPGASKWFAGAVVVYANEWKQAALGVQPRTLARHGAVSEQTVSEMVAGLRQRFKVDAGIAVSGIAGPSGGTPEKPVGTVCIATETPEHRRVRTVCFPGNRETVRLRAVMSALNQLRRDLLESEPSHSEKTAKSMKCGYNNSERRNPM
jgi:nicotinamide-nucleotide amidase